MQPCVFLTKRRFSPPAIPFPVRTRNAVQYKQVYPSKATASPSRIQGKLPHSDSSTSLEHATLSGRRQHRSSFPTHPVSDHAMVALVRIISLVFLFCLSLTSSLAQVIPDIPAISRAPSPSSLPPVSPSSSQSALPSPAPSPPKSPSPSLPGVPSEPAIPDSPAQTDPPSAVQQPSEEQPQEDLSPVSAPSVSPKPDSPSNDQGTAPALATVSPVSNPAVAAGSGPVPSPESAEADAPNVTPTASTAASVSPSGDGSGDVPDTDGSEPEPTQLTPQPSVSPSTVPVAGGGGSTNSTEQPGQGAQPTPKSCGRDVTQPRPALGISPSRYAFSVFASAAAVAFANMLYKLAAKWETNQPHMAVRIISIVLARLCIIFSVKLSSALVAVTANSPGIDNGADVGGAYLTWASAILSSLYHESVMMTFIATGYVVQTDTWYPNLRIYLSPWYNHLRNPETEFFELQDMEEPNDSSPGDQVRSRYQALTLYQRIKGGRIDRHLLILTALLYVAMELITLIISLLQLLHDLSGASTKDSIFVDAGDSPESARCPIRLSDLAGMFASVHDACLFHRSTHVTDETFLPWHYLVSLSLFCDRRCPRSLPFDKAAIFGATACSNQ